MSTIPCSFLRLAPTPALELILPARFSQPRKRWLTDYETFLMDLLFKRIGHARAD